MCAVNGETELTDLVNFISPYQQKKGTLDISNLFLFLQSYLILNIHKKKKKKFLLCFVVTFTSGD